MKRFLDLGEGYSYLFAGKGLITDVTETHTITFKFNKPFGPFISTLFRFPILNKDLVVKNIKKPGDYGEMGDYGKDFLLTQDAGSGPYMVKEFPYEEFLLMEKNPDYFLPMDPRTPNEIKMIGTTQTVTVRTLMSRGELEISDQWQAEESFKALNRIQGTEIGKLYQGQILYFMLHTRKAPTDDIHFRKAMAWGMDYQTVTTKIWPGAKQARGPIAQNIPGANPNSLMYELNLEKAREELKKSKYWGKLDQYPVEIYWVAEVPDEEKVALLFLSNMSKLGIDVKVTKIPWASAVDALAAQDTSPHVMILFDSPQYPEAGSLLEARYTSQTANTWEQNEWMLDKNYDAMVNDALATSDRNQRMKKYMEIQDYIVERSPSIFVFEKPVKHAYRKDRIEWGAVNGEGNSMNGFSFAGRFIKMK